MRTFEAAMQLKDLKEGDTLTARQADALEYFLGGILAPLRKLKPDVITITPGKDGDWANPTVTKNGVPAIGVIKVTAPGDGEL